MDASTTTKGGTMKGYTICLTVVDNGHNKLAYYTMFGVFKADARKLAIEAARMDGYTNCRVLSITKA